MKNGVGFSVFNEFESNAFQANLLDNGTRLSISFNPDRFAPVDEHPKTFDDFRSTVNGGEHLENPWTWMENGKKRTERLILTLKTDEADFARGEVQITVNTKACPHSDFNEVTDALKRLIAIWFMDYWALG